MSRLLGLFLTSVQTRKVAIYHYERSPEPAAAVVGRSPIPIMSIVNRVAPVIVATPVIRVAPVNSVTPITIVMVTPVDRLNDALQFFKDEGQLQEQPGLMAPPRARTRQQRRLQDALAFGFPLIFSGSGGCGVVFFTGVDVRRQLFPERILALQNAKHRAEARFPKVVHQWNVLKIPFSKAPRLPSTDSVAAEQLPPPKSYAHMPRRDCCSLIGAFVVHRKEGRS